MLIYFQNYNDQYHKLSCVSRNAGCFHIARTETVQHTKATAAVTFSICLQMNEENLLHHFCDPSQRIYTAKSISIIGPFFEISIIFQYHGVIYPDQFLQFYFFKIMEFFKVTEILVHPFDSITLQGDERIKNFFYKLSKTNFFYMRLMYI